MGATVTEASAAPQKPAAQPTIGGSVYVKPQDIAWEPTQFEGISIKVLYEDKEKGEMTCLLKWEPGATPADAPASGDRAELGSRWLLLRSRRGLPRRRVRVAPYRLVSPDPFGRGRRDPRDLSQAERLPARRRLCPQGRAVKQKQFKQPRRATSTAGVAANFR